MPDPQVPLELPFYCTQQDLESPDFEARRSFWDSHPTVEWFKNHGYRLYRRVYDDDGGMTDRTVPCLPFKETEEGAYPYAYYDTYVMRDDMRPLGAFDYVGKIAFAQDSSNRHVVIKVVPDGPEEYRILHFLHKQPLEVLEKNCIMPVLDLLPTTGYWFLCQGKDHPLTLQLKRWGIDINAPSLQKAFEVLDIMHSTLTPWRKFSSSLLTSISENSQVVKFANVAVNHFGDATATECSLMRPSLRAQRLLSYAIFDFDYSIMLPPGADRMSYRLPYQRSWGTFNTTMILLKHLCGQIPFLAPLLDKMTTRHLESRFTAQEALQFFEQMYYQLCESELNRSIGGEYAKEDASLPPELTQKWAAYREPPISWTTKVLRRICGRIWAIYLIACIRWISFRTTALL
ncbi:LOW QUALITY PROTEIN: hypothetical protein CVT26_012442 [Gymnopilus dilepis]|uniref:Protein kinase domain-containing protein n=1 Tax=Gymnopilus dilepis TaxID=231916 RepID=A0A409YWB8_9AGAR|nr:LOW QUALITY PROTEIN: hypothetical protein CVT26_012442 [Gymnopilus dilepis]